LLPPFVAILFGIVLAAFSFQLEPGLPTPSAGNIAPLFTPEVQFWAGSLTLWSAEQGVDPNLAATIMQIESCGHPTIRSSAGAAGLFQVMPFHFQPDEVPNHPNTNALRGLGYLREALNQTGGDTRLAFAGYNGGIGVTVLPESSWAEETRRYVYWATGIYADASLGASQSARLQEWLYAGGASLCQQAHRYLNLP
jgi:soluble lytic murein transglycosylase-like protein